MSPLNNKLGNMDWQESQTQSIAWQTRAQMKKLQLHYQSQTSSFCIKRKGLLDRRRQNPELKPVFIGYTWITSTTKGQSTTRFNRTNYWNSVRLLRRWSLTEKYHDTCEFNPENWSGLNFNIYINARQKINTKIAIFTWLEPHKST